VVDGEPTPAAAPEARPFGNRVLVGLAVLAGLGLLGGYGVAMRARPRPTSVALSSPGPQRQHHARLIYVHVGGAVAEPGLYRLRDGSRVDDAIRVAGGMLENADADALNLAAKVRDGDKVLVPAKGAPGQAPAAGGSAAGGSASQGARVNLNTATAADLETLPGIGPALAERILTFRQQHGGFRRVEQLLDVPGIGPKKFEELRDLVTI
jgi:competence protein ComEA